MSRFAGSRRRFLINGLLGGLLGGLALSSGSSWAAADFVDPLDAPAEPVPDANRAPVLALARAGNRIVGVGLRGLVVASDNGGRSWRQMPSPVQSDLTCLSFVDERLGWAAGHDGVILHSDDGGSTWRRQLEGRQAGVLFADHYRRRIGAGEEDLKPFLEQVELNVAGGPTLPYLGIHFATPQVGYAVGSFGMAVATDDGGRTWRPILELIENPSFLNLNAIRPIGESLYVVGERGMVFRLEDQRKQFAALPTGYEGSLFGIVGTGQGDLIAYGLRGTVYRGRDGGAGWEQVSNPEPMTLIAGVATPNAGAVILLTLAGTALVSTDRGASFAVGFERLRADATDILMTGDNEAVVASLGGPVRVEKLT